MLLWFLIVFISRCLSAAIRRDTSQISSAGSIAVSAVILGETVQLGNLGDSNINIPLGEKKKLGKKEKDCGSSLNPNGEGINHGDDGKGAEIVILPALSTEEDSEKCYFHRARISSLETKERPPKSQVRLDCNGRLEKMENFLKEDEGESFGGKYQLDLILCRGAAICDVDWEDQSQQTFWSSKLICEEHARELLTEWNYVRFNHISITRRNGRMRTTCSAPSDFGPTHSVRPVQKMKITVSVSEAHAILHKEGLLLHPGLPICSLHKEYVTRTHGQHTVESRGYHLDPAPSSGLLSQSDDVDSDARYSCQLSQEEAKRDPDYRDKSPPIFPRATDVSEELQSAFYTFVREAKVEHIISRKNFMTTTHRQRKRKAAATRNMQDLIYLIAAPDAPEELKRMVSDMDEMDVWTKRRVDQYTTMMKTIAKQYLNAENKVERLIILSIVADILPMSEIREYIPGLSLYMLKKSKMMARGVKKEIVNQKRQKYNPIAVNYFIQFITGGSVMVGLPFGERRAFDSSGQEFDVPNTIRMHRDVYIIDMYENYMRETGNLHLMLSRSTLYRILDVCVATKRKALTCVNYFIADAANAVDSSLSILQRWESNGVIEKHWSQSVQKGLKEAYQYIRTDFRSHIKIHSRVADHCATYALSDPENADFSDTCERCDYFNHHQHDLRCDRCEHVKYILGDIRDTAKTLLENVKENTEDTKNVAAKERKALLEEDLQAIINNEKYILELRRHIIRSQHTTLQREAIIDNMIDFSALLTLDYAQKFLPASHREKQSEYFGKKGISYHITHAITKIRGIQATHSFVHILQNDLQDSMSVTSILTHVLEELAKMEITVVTLRSDNAGAYHSSATISSLHYISEYTGVSITRYSFSESQDGKSSADRVASHVKRKVKDYVDAGNDATTPKEFFLALTSARPLKGISVHMGYIREYERSTTKLEGIGFLNDFYIMDNGIQAFRHNQIGKGVFIPQTRMMPNKGSFVLENEGGFTADNVPDVDEEVKNVEFGKNTHFWLTSRCVGVTECPQEHDQPDTIIYEDEKPPLYKDGKVFRCPEEQCAATFLSFSNLERHVERGKHSPAPERITLKDFALNQFVHKLEGFSDKGNIPFVADALETLQQSSADDSDISPRGWALKDKRKSARFSDGVKQFLTELFDIGIAQKRKFDPKDAEKMLAEERKPDGSRKFSPSERLNHRQIASFFSRLAAKRQAQNRNKRSESNFEEENENEYEGEYEEIYRKDASTFYQDDIYHQEVRTNLQHIFDVDETHVDPFEIDKFYRIVKTGRFTNELL